MYHLVNYLKKVSTVAITGHVNPDGDCIGSCMGVWLYLRDNFPNILADVYLQPVQEMFSYIEGLEQIHTECDTEKKYDLLILLDIGSKKRIGVPGPYLETAAKTICFDNHITNNTLGCIMIQKLALLVRLSGNFCKRIRFPEHVQKHSIQVLYMIQAFFNIPARRLEPCVSPRG